MPVSAPVADLRTNHTSLPGEDRGSFISGRTRAHGSPARRLAAFAAGAAAFLGALSSGYADESTPAEEPEVPVLTLEEIEDEPTALEACLERRDRQAGLRGSWNIADSSGLDRNGDNHADRVACVSLEEFPASVDFERDDNREVPFESQPQRRNLDLIVANGSDEYVECRVDTAALEGVLRDGRLSCLARDVDVQPLVKTFEVAPQSHFTHRFELDRYLCGVSQVALTCEEKVLSCDHPTKDTEIANGGSDLISEALPPYRQADNLPCYATRLNCTEGDLSADEFQGRFSGSVCEKYSGCYLDENSSVKWVAPGGTTSSDSVTDQGKGFQKPCSPTRTHFLCPTTTEGVRPPIVDRNEILFAGFYTSQGTCVKDLPVCQSGQTKLGVKHRGCTLWSGPPDNVCLRKICRQDKSVCSDSGQWVAHSRVDCGTTTYPRPTPRPPRPRPRPPTRPPGCTRNCPAPL